MPISCDIRLIKVINVVAVLSVTVINQVASSACSHLFSRK